MAMERPLVLASLSPRRREGLARMGFKFEAIASDVDEEALATNDPIETALLLAREKARAGLRLRPNAAVLGADTVVALQAEGRWTLLGKPADANEAIATLRRLRGREHLVVTAVCLASPDGERAEHAAARVRLRDLSDAEIATYVATGDPLDKAGAYAIQHPMGLVARIEGSFDTVVGFPADVVRRLLEG